MPCRGAAAGGSYAGGTWCQVCRAAMSWLSPPHRTPGLARSIGDSQDIVKTPKAKSANLRAIGMAARAGKCFIDMLEGQGPAPR